MTSTDQTQNNTSSPTKDGKLTRVSAEQQQDTSTSTTQVSADSLPSARDIASKTAEISAKLTAGGTNTQMREWYFEYKELRVELETAKAREAASLDTV